jgi:hypothetical protein
MNPEKAPLVSIAVKGKLRESRVAVLLDRLPESLMTS